MNCQVNWIAVKALDLKSACPPQQLFDSTISRISKNMQYIELNLLAASILIHLDVGR